MKLINHSEVKRLMEKYDIKPRKRLGQNFLIDNNIITKIIREAEVAGKDVVEIGPGMGSMTIALAQIAKTVTAVELDKKLLPVLEETVGEYSNVKVINEDALKVNFDEVMEKHGITGRYHVVANLPYYITTPIIMHLIESDFKIDSLTFMVQKEVADRMMAKPGTKDYGALTIGVQYLTDVSLIAKVPPTVFVPRPEVNSSVIKLVKLENPLIDIQDPNFFFQVVKAGFGKRRKTLLNSLANSPLELTKEKIISACLQADIDSQRRMEDLSIVEIGRLAGYLKEDI